MKTKQRMQKAALMLVVAATATSATAQPKPIETIDQNAQLDHINPTTAMDALAAVTGNSLEATDPTGEPILIGTATNGLTFEVQFFFCESDDGEDSQQHCKGVRLTSRWDSPEGADHAKTQETISEFLKNNPAVNAGVFENGAIYLARYIIADYGTKQGNLVSEYSNFIRSSTDFQNTLSASFLE